MLAPPVQHNQRDDLLEISILEAVNVPYRRDGTPRETFFSAHIPSTEQRWRQTQATQENGRSSNATAFFFSVAERQEQSIQFSVWDRKGSDDEEDNKLLGECGLPLYYIGWEWVDAKLKIKPANPAHARDYASSYVRARMRFTDFKSATMRSAEVSVADELEDGAKPPSERKKIRRHTLGKRSHVQKHNEYLMSLEVRAVGGPEYSENMEQTDRHIQQDLSQPARSISLNVSDSSDSSDEDSRPKAKGGNMLTKRLSRDLTKLRQLLTSEDKSSHHGKKFWTIGRHSDASLEVSHSADQIPSVRAIDWAPPPSRTVSDLETAGKVRTKHKKHKEKGHAKKAHKKDRSSLGGGESGSATSGGGSSDKKVYKARKEKGHKRAQSHDGMESGIMLAVIEETEPATTQTKPADKEEEASSSFSHSSDFSASSSADEAGSPPRNTRKKCKSKKDKRNDGKVNSPSTP